MASLKSAVRPLVLAFLTTVFMASTLSRGGENPSRSRIWLDRPWEIRYLIFVGPRSNLDAKLAVARAVNIGNMGQSERLYLEGIALFDLTVQIKLPRKQDVGAIVIAFGNAGRVTTPHQSASPLIGKRNVLNDVVLIREDATELKPYDLAHWSEGVPDDVLFSPAVCDSWDMDRYQDNWDNDDPTGNFGCREWTAQLYNRDQPYIDVTSYQPSGNFIGEFIGWSRFEDPAKPVIGKHGNTWVCLHECPGNEKPGVIPDIKSWAKKHKFPLPTRPARQPTYPNALYKDDLNEFVD